MHIGLVTPGFPPTRGGVEQHVGQLASRLAASGHEVVVFTAVRGLRRKRTTRVGGLTVHTYPAWRNRSMSISPRLLVAVWREHRRFDVLHVHSAHALTGLAAALASRIPLVFTPHYHGGGHTALASVLHRIYHLAAVRLFAAPQRIICVSESERKQLAHDFTGTDHRIVVIGNGVDVTAVRAAKGYPDEPPTVLVIGRLEPYKRADLVIAAMANVPSAQLVVIGDGSDRAALIRQASDAGLLERLRILSNLEDDAVHRWLATASVLVSMSEHEAFGMVPLEAAAAGARVVLSDIGAHRELAHGPLVDVAQLVASEPAAVARAIRQQLIAAEAGRTTVEVPDWDEITVRTEKIYLQAMGDSHTTVVAQAAPTRQAMAFVDRQWADHWCASYVAEIDAPSVADVRTMFARYFEVFGNSVLTGRLDFARGQWVPVPEAERAAHLERVVVAVDDPKAGGEEEHLRAARAPVDWDAPFLVSVGQNSIVVSLCHSVGDAVSFSRFVLMVAALDLDGLLGMESRASTRDIAVATLRQAPAKATSWLPEIRARRQRSAETVASAPIVTERHLPDATLVASTIGNPQLRALTKWRNRAYPGASLSAVLAAGVYRAMTEEGIRLDPDGYNVLIDTRRHLGAGHEQLPGNLAKSLWVGADLGDPAAVAAAQTRLVDSGWALPSLLVGALLAARRRPGALLTTERHDRPSQLSFSLMPSLPGLADLPWLPGRPRRFIGHGYPTGANGMSVFAIRMREHLELTATFDAGVGDAEAVRRALAAVADLPALFAESDSRAPLRSLS